MLKAANVPASTAPAFTFVQLESSRSSLDRLAKYSLRVAHSISSKSMTFAASQEGRPAMGKRDLGAKYGASKNTTQLINAAIRAECPGGNEAIDALRDLRTLHDNRGLPDTAAALAAMRRVVDAMAAEIRRRYDMPPVASSDLQRPHGDAAD